MNGSIDKLELRQKDISVVSDFLRELYATTNVDRLPGVILKGIRTLIPCEHVGYNEIDNKTNATYCAMHPYVPEVVQKMPVLEERFSEHPILDYHRRSGDPAPHRITDFISRRQFRQLGIYHDFYQHVDTEYQMGIVFSPSETSTVIGLSLNRKNADFTSRDLLIADLLRPHLLQARLNAQKFQAMQKAQADSHRGMETTGTALIVSDARGTIHLGSNHSVILLARYFPDYVYHVGQLPDAMRRWIQACQYKLTPGGFSNTPLPALMRRNPHSLLVAEYYPNFENEFDVVLHEYRLAQEINSQAARQLTPREKEVMHWVVEGKTNAEIAVIFNISSRTVEKHMEHILSKLMVSNRSAAIGEYLRFFSGSCYF